MGIYDRDYERSYDTGSGWRDSGDYGFGGGGGRGPGGGFASWTANSKLLAVMVAVYVAQVLLERPLQGRFSEYLSMPADWWREPWRIYSLVTYSLLHSTQNIFHLLFNGLALFFFGRIIEMRLGGREYLTFFFTAAAFAGLTWCIAENVAAGGNPRAILLGASGGIAGVLVLFALFGGALTLATLYYRSTPLPRRLTRVDWLARLHHPKSGVPYGVALAAGTLALWPETNWFAGLG